MINKLKLLVKKKKSKISDGVSIFEKSGLYIEIIRKHCLKKTVFFLTSKKVVVIMNA